MKNIYIALSFLAATSATNLMAQSKATKTADKLFTQFEYVKAAEAYLKLTSNDATAKVDPYVYKQLGDSYYNMFNSVEAAKWYEKAVATPQDAETYFQYAQMLKANGNYEAASKQMVKFASKKPDDARAKAFGTNPNYLSKLQKKTKNYDLKKLDINTEQSDFGALLNNNILYFATARNMTRKNYGWLAEPFLDIYQSTYNADGTITGADALTELNTKFHDGPVTLSKDGKTMYFASESFKDNKFEKDKTKKFKFGQVNLFKATKTDKTWGNITPMSFNSKSYSTSNPSLSNDAKTLYFSSNMPGGMGGNDIWKTTINQDGTTTTPQNLGKSVNTEGDESFPYISQDNTKLYFASSGRQGFGGLDVFELDLTKANSEATNLGAPVNTNRDDFGFTFYDKENLGFVSSNRENSDDIYKVIPVCRLNIQAIVTNEKTGAILSNANVTILDDKKTIVANEVSNERGEVVFEGECEKAYTLTAKKSGFETGSFPIAATSRTITTNVAAKLNPTPVIITDKEIILSPIYFEYDKSNITEDGAFELNKLVVVMNENPKLVIFAKSHTDNRGSDAYNANLSNARAKSTVQYIISKGITQERISGKGMGETEPIIDCKEACTEEEHAKNRRSEFLIVK